MQLSSILSSLGLNQASYTNQNSSSSAGFDLALSSLLGAISQVNRQNNSTTQTYTNDTNNNLPQININIEKIEINGQNLETVQSMQTSSKIENVNSSSVSEEIKLTDKNSTIEIEKAIIDSSQKYGVDPDLVRAVIKVESDFKTDVVSRSGAKGLMQLMPENCEYYGVTDPFDITQNIDGGVRHLKDYIDKYNGDIQMGLMAYNGGPTRMANRGVKSIDDIYKMPKETQNYVPKVMKYYEQYKSESV